MPFAFGRSVVGFWAGSLAGFVAWGYVVAETMIRGMGESQGVQEAVSTALVLGLAGALLLGAPAALLFAWIMRRARAGGWAVALATGALLSIALAVPLGAFAQVTTADWGCVREPLLFAAVAAAAMMAGAVGGTIGGRSVRTFARPAPVRVLVTR